MEIFKKIKKNFIKKGTTKKTIKKHIDENTCVEWLLGLNHRN